MPQRLRLLDLSATLRDEMARVAESLDVPFVYHPLAYAWPAHEAFVRKLGRDAPRRALLVGLNPGPWGMAQTGIPFTDPEMARSWMGVEGRVAQPARLHPKRPVLGFASTRRDLSGERLYGWAKARYHSAERFFAEFWIATPCPLLFFDAEGRNVTPDKLPRAEWERMRPVYDAHLASIARLLQPEWIVGLGSFAAAQARRVADAEGLDATVRGALHPSPAHPRNNHGWGVDSAPPFDPPAP